MNYEEQKKRFEIAYATGSDAWSRIPYELRGSNLISRLSPSSLILDIGSGRGRFAFELSHMGFRVIGIDYVSSIVNKNNDEVKSEHLEHMLRFTEGDALDIPFTDEGFDAVTDFGLLQHLSPSDWNTYSNEVSRVLKHDGFFLNVSLSRETTSFFTFSPKASNEGGFEYEGFTYHFFTQEEIRNIFGDKFEIVEQKLEHTKLHGDDVVVLVSLLKKK